jgi:hypothetical protein
MNCLVLYFCNKGCSFLVYQLTTKSSAFDFERFGMSCIVFCCRSTFTLFIFSSTFFDSTLRGTSRRIHLFCVRIFSLQFCMLLKITPFLGTRSQGRPGIWPTYYYSKYIDTSWGPYRAYAFLKKQDNRAGLGVCKAYGCKRVRNFSRQKRRRVEVHLRQ